MQELYDNDIGHDIYYHICNHNYIYLFLKL